MVRHPGEGVRHSGVRGMAGATWSMLAGSRLRAG